MTDNTPAVAEDRPTLKQLIERMKPEIARVLPNQMSPERMARIAVTVLKQTPALNRTTPESFLGALLTASQLGLEPGPLGEAYLVPYGNVCTFIPGYRGLVKLARNSGQLVDIWAEIVYSKDVFRRSLGLHRDLVHEPADGERGEPTHVYAAAELRDGGRPFVVLTIGEVEAIRSRSRASRNGPWVTDWEAMAKKTAVRQLAKWLPLSAEMAAAVTFDGTVRTDVATLVDVTPTYIEGEEVADVPAVEAAPEPEPDGADVLPLDQAGEVQMAGRAELAKLKAIRERERYDSAEAWADFLSSAVGGPVVSEKDLTLVQARAVIGMFQGEQ